MKNLCICVLLLWTLNLAAQPGEWGKKVKGVQFGLVITDSGYGLQGELYARNASSRKKIFINQEWQMKIFYQLGDSRYEAQPATLKYIQEEIRFRSAAGGNKNFLQFTQLLPKDEAVLLRSFLISKPQWVADDPCYQLEDRKDELEVEIVDLFTTESTDTLQASTGPVHVPYCQELGFCEAQQKGTAKLFQSLLKVDSPEILELCLDIAQDQEQDEYVRNMATRYLAEVNTPLTRDVLYRQCLREEVLFSDVLDDFLSTRDPRSGEMFEKFWDHEEERIQTIVAWHIGDHQDEAHFDLLEKLMESPHRWTRHTAVEAMQNFTSDEARNALYRSLKDPDLGVRTMAVRGVGEIGDESSLPFLYEFLINEDPGHVGYVQVAWETVEKLAGRSFDRDLEQLEEWLGER